MDARYSHPEVRVRFSPMWTYETWLRIESLAVKHSPHIPAGEKATLTEWLDKVDLSDRDAIDIEKIERQTNHDVVAFLTWLRSGAPGNTGRWIHYGLTSSDIVDTAQGYRFGCIQDDLDREVTKLWEVLGRWKTDDPVVLGRTHGQPAEPTSMRIRARHWRSNLMSARVALEHHSTGVQVAKMSGPVGTFAHNPPEFERKVASELGLLARGPGSSQILPRAELALWAASAAVFAASCAKIAMDTRLMNLLGEADETKKEGEVGSSSMAHKRNPIIAEQLTGLARVMQGYASMLQPLDLWLERDISNSSVERIAVPAIWHLLFHVTRQTTKLLTVLNVSASAAMHNLEQHQDEAWTSFYTNMEIHAGSTVEEAREYALGSHHESYDVEGDARQDFLRQYPK